MTATNEQVQFRLLVMPCCQFQCCWVNPRLPTYCPECGCQVYSELKVGNCTYIDSIAWLRIEDTNLKKGNT